MEPGDEFYLRAFARLSTTRDFGSSQGPIPWDKAVEYAAMAGLDADMVEPFCSIIDELDAAYLKWSEEEAEKKRRTGARQNARGRNRGRK